MDEETLNILSWWAITGTIGVPIGLAFFIGRECYRRWKRKRQTRRKIALVFEGMEVVTSIGHGKVVGKVEDLIVVELIDGPLDGSFVEIEGDSGRYTLL